MPKLGSFIYLDFLTVKPYFTSKILLVYALSPLLITTFSNNSASGLGFGMMLGTMILGYPFSLSEKSNMDALYCTLSIDRKTVVLGRYLFSLATDIASVLFAFAVTQAGLFLSGIAGFREAGSTVPTIQESLLTILALAVIFILVQSMQLPIYFKMGYNKAKFASLIPFLVLMAAFVGLGAAGSGFDAIGAFFSNFASPWFCVAVALAVALAIFISFRISISFYQKREF
jgi:hypothetical protein